MKKFLSLFLAVLISLSLLSASALAKSGGGNQSAGAPGQQQSSEKPDKGNNGKGSENGKGNAGSQGQTGQKDPGKADSEDTKNGQSGNDETNGQKNGNSQNQETKNPQFFRQGNHLNVQTITDAIGKLTDSDLAAKLNGLLTAYKDSKPGQDAQDAWTTLLNALKAAGVSVDTIQPVRRWWTDQQGKPIDVDAISTAIGQLTDSVTSAKLNELLTAYKEAEVGKAVHEALTALLDALKAAGIDVEIMQPPMKEGETPETPEQDKPIDVDAIKTAIGQLTDSAVASQLTTLLTAYQEAVSAGEAAVQAALTALLDAMKAVGITEGVE